MVQEQRLQIDQGGKEPLTGPIAIFFAQGKAMRGDILCPGERDEPLEKPELTDQVLKLAGVLPY